MFKYKSKLARSTTARLESDHDEQRGYMKSSYTDRRLRSILLHEANQIILISLKDM